MGKLFITVIKALSMQYLARKLVQLDRTIDRVKFLEGRVEGLAKTNAQHAEALEQLLQLIVKHKIDQGTSKEDPRDG